MLKKWNVLPPPPDDFINSHPELPTTISRLLWNRNLRDQKRIDEFLNPDYSQDVHDPFLFQDMEKATDIIFKSIKNQENIVVHGDYDADGVCASAIIINGLRKLGAQNVDVFIPHRETDGYGLNPRTIEFLAEKKTDLIITCDCGISNYDEVAQAKKKKIKVIITDHHVVPKKVPKADAIIHPLVPDEPYPDKGLCGAAVGFKLVQGLLRKYARKNATLPDGQTFEGFEKWMLDLVAIASIGDMVPLLGESRTLTRYGLTVINKTRNIGLKKLLIVAGMADENGNSKRGVYDSYNMSFQIIPRINAAGRMDHANFAFALLMATDEKEAEDLAAQLNKNNTDRQKITEQYVSEARRQIKETGQKDNPVLFVVGQGWPTGILGLISGKIKDDYYRPSIVMGEGEKEIVGSGRSIREFNLILALQSMPEIFGKFGGHPQACGFTLKDKSILEEFKTKLTTRAATQTAEVDMTPQITVDAEVDLDEVNWKLYDLLQKFEPFGQANEEPKYLAKSVTLVNIDPVGQDGKHLRLTVKHNSHLLKKTIGFGLGDIKKYSENWKESLKPGDKIDMVFSIGVNEWNGNRELQLTVEDIKKL
ncbi:MAG: single-stranded-DNA-specific exonuclease RecJ [Candidatus Magasanikbacteria bacterium RIFOXYD1_FULL_40_23]|uniref:Single-stranded-DNA-specific exonuclease RecJ n=1 Tax=Candidatus Magasanikbacteria bacterium RIFOXYD1_FULL_40_23 TaxID=1798705 RepID=A0A1F6PAN3_9BACT|nr:MAG: single-stranded-DNA-specific exonuclease RecJ [Candidatus Magasanikbacteria bacterium RIFOXYD1_FULL_40_23]